MLIECVAKEAVPPPAVQCALFAATATYGSRSTIRKSAYALCFERRSSRRRLVASMRCREKTYIVLRRQQRRYTIPLYIALSSLFRHFRGCCCATMLLLPCCCRHCRCFSPPLFSFEIRYRRQACFAFFRQMSIRRSYAYVRPRCLRRRHFGEFLRHGCHAMSLLFLSVMISRRKCLYHCLMLSRVLSRDVRSLAPPFFSARPRCRSLSRHITLLPILIAFFSFDFVRRLRHVIILSRHYV